MEAQTYETEASVVEDHWWFRGRRQLFARLLRPESIGKRARILDIGSSTGTNLILLKALGFTNFTGIDSSEASVRFCANKGLSPVVLADACKLPFEAGSADFVMATDILEHLEDDHRGVQEIYRVLKPGSRAIVTVPAFRMLWGLQDEVSHHYRRYSRAEFKNLLSRAGFEIEQIFFFNFLLFFPILFVRLLWRLGLVKGVTNENHINSRGLNEILYWIFRIDTCLARVLRPPWGVSLCAVIRKL